MHTKFIFVPSLNKLGERTLKFLKNNNNMFVFMENFVKYANYD